MNNNVNIQQNKLMKLDDTMLMYGIYNAEMLSLCAISNDLGNHGFPQFSISSFLKQ